MDPMVTDYNPAWVVERIQRILGQMIPLATVVVDYEVEDERYLNLYIRVTAIGGRSLACNPIYPMDTLPREETMVKQAVGDFIYYWTEP
jgi:hypothetical protein